MTICFVALGTNLGNRRENIKQAIKKINSLKATKVIKQSQIIDTLPVGGPRLQPNFLNACIKIKTNLSVVNLFKKFKNIEKEMGRKKTVRFGPRIIDLDILLYGNKSFNNKYLTIPHEKMFEREFVLGPLVELL